MVDLKVKAKELAKELDKANAKYEQLQKKEEALEKKHERIQSKFNKLVYKQDDVRDKLVDKLDKINDKLKEKASVENEYYMGKVYKSNTAGSDMIYIDEVIYHNGELHALEGNVITNRLTIKEVGTQSRWNSDYVSGRVQLKDANLVYNEEDLEKAIKIKLSEVFESLKKQHNDYISKKGKLEWNLAKKMKKQMAILCNSIDRYKYPFDRDKLPGIFEVISDWQKANDAYYRSNSY